MCNSKKKQSLKTIASKLMGCGSCSSLSLSSIFTPHHGRRNNNHYSTTSRTTTTAVSVSAASPFTAVEKDSSEPYVDFRASMLQMIVENQIYTKEDLRNLLTCFLQLNAPSLHGVIITAFTDIWNSILFSSSTTPAAHPHPSPSPPPRPRPRRRRQRRNPNDRPPRAYVRPNSYQY